MFPSPARSSAIAMALTACLAVASAAQAGGYAGNGCVAKKQGALAKYTKSVGKAWDKYPADAVSRDAAIADAQLKLDAAWTKEEAKAVKKNASCDESTATSAQAGTIVNDAVTSVSTEDYQPLVDYIADALKAYGKYIKDPLKDPGKANVTTALAAASTDNLAGASVAVTAAATALKDDLVAATTRAPNYPDTFAAEAPTECAGGVCGGTATACATNTDCRTHLYKKDELKPRCVDDDPYVYFAKRGTSNNVLMYYQGGGACWSNESCFTIVPLNGSICKRTVDPIGDNPGNTTTGFADYNDPTNPFYDWSVVFVSYCTCDIHWGENDKSYGDGTALHRGRVNAAIAEKFAREHFVDPDRVFVTGSSAGSYGAIMNSYYLMKEVWPNADFSVMGDAGVGIITKHFLTTYLANNWGIEKNFPEDLPGVALPVDNLSLVDLIDGLAQKFPDARFANYDSSYDGGGGSQSNFFQVMRFPAPPFLLNASTRWQNYWETACTWNACMREFKADNASRASQPGRTNNYRYFTGAGSRHTIFGSDKIYTETKSRKLNGEGMTFAAWVTAMIGNTGDWVDVDCSNPGGDCNLTNSCQGGTNAGGFCSKKCSGGDNDTLDCVNTAGCPGGGTCVPSNADCPGGSCQLDPDTANAPYADNDTVTCPPTTCPCGPAAATCAGGINDTAPCVTDADCKSNPNNPDEQGSCQYVHCSLL